MHGSGATNEREKGNREESSTIGKLVRQQCDLLAGTIAAGDDRYCIRFLNVHYRLEYVR